MMGIFWGDISNPCGIGYGYGSPENALDTSTYCPIWMVRVTVVLPP
jgi:hypothetical protein